MKNVLNFFHHVDFAIFNGKIIQLFCPQMTYEGQNTAQQFFSLCSRVYHRSQKVPTANQMVDTLEALVAAFFQKRRFLLLSL